jgi:CBS domain containing-hemolysin-like protein
MIYSALLVVVLLLVLVLASYVDRLYSEKGKFLRREFQDNVDSWEELVEPRMILEDDLLALSAIVLMQISFGCLAVEFGALLFDHGFRADRPSFGEIAQVVLAVCVVVLIFNRLIPHALFARTHGRWIRHWRLVLIVLFFVVLPVTLLLNFLLSIASLAETSESKQEENKDEDVSPVDALIEAGEEEGILEESDRELVRSAVEFGDTIVREVMTPRPELFAVPVTLTIAEFTEELRQHPYSRVPVWQERLDNIVGIAFAHDLLQIADTDAERQLLSSILRPVAFVPETKKCYELLREMQHEKQHMRIVIDEYGSVAGLVTIEDLLEEIVGNISDEHEADSAVDEPARGEDGQWIFAGATDVDELQSVMEGWEPDEQYKSQTVGGLVSEIAGRIPLAGEVVETDDLRFEVLASTERRVERVRITPRAKMNTAQEKKLDAEKESREEQR